MRKIFTIVFVITIFFAFSCKKESDDEKDSKPVVKVFDSYLYEDDLAQMLPPGTSPEDSIKIVESYINSWVNNQLMLHYANQYLQDKLDEIDKQTEEFKNSLLIHEFKDLLFETNADTVNNSEIEQYYNEHGSDFILQNTIVKGFLFKVEKDNEGLDDLKKSLEALDNADIDIITAFMKTNGGYIDNFSNNWRKLSDVLAILPKNIGNENQFLKQNIHQIYDDKNFYYINILDYVSKGKVAPIDYVRTSIIKVLRQKRQTEILEKFKDDKYKQAIEKGDLEFFN